MTTISVPWKTYFYYRNKLSTNEQTIYNTILNGLLNWEQKIALPFGCDFDRIYEIYIMVLKDCPILYHVSNRLRGTVGLRTHIAPTYTMDEKTYWSLYSEVKQFLDNCSSLLSERSIFDSLRILHDAIRKHVDYHDTSTINEHNVLGTIIDRKAVCEGIAKAYKLMCDVNMIPCIVVFGRSLEENQYVRTCDKEKAEEENHAWNLVKIDEKWYCVDVTFDLTAHHENHSLPFYYDYFLCSDARFSKNHRASQFVPMPVCSEDFNLHRRAGKYVNCENDIIAITKKAISQKQAEVVFEISPNFTIDTEQILKALHKGSRFASYSTITYSYNKVMRIFHAELS